MGLMRKGRREVHLWWSGNNAILRSWSEPEGLARIKKLDTIHLYETEVRRNMFPSYMHYFWDADPDIGWT